MSPTDTHQPSADPRSGAAPGEAAAGAVVPHDSLINALVMAMATMAEPNEAGHHIQRIGLYVQALANQLRQSAAYADQWPDATLDAMVRASALHDIGNSAVPDRILLKPGALSEDEFEVVRNHPIIGRDIIEQIRHIAGGTTVFLDMAHQITYGHHERWDGHGYPQGLASDQNPTPAQVMAIVDAYDALTSDRVYRAGVPHDKAMQLIFQERGAQFAPDMVDALIEIQDEFADIARRFADSETDLQKKFDYLAKAIAESP